VRVEQRQVFKGSCIVARVVEQTDLNTVQLEQEKTFSNLY